MLCFMTKKNPQETSFISQEQMSTEQREKIDSFKNFLAPLTQEAKEIIIESIAQEYNGGTFEQLSMEDQDYILHTLSLMNQRESQEGPLEIKQRIHDRLGLHGAWFGSAEQVSHNVS